MKDYKIRADLKNGESRETTYQKLIFVMGLEDEDYLGLSIKEGGISQLRYVLVVTKGNFPEIKRIAAFDETGSEVAGVGIDLDEFLK